MRSFLALASAVFLGPSTAHAFQSSEYLYDDDDLVWIVICDCQPSVVDCRTRIDGLTDLSLVSSLPFNRWSCSLV